MTEDERKRLEKKLIGNLDAKDWAEEFIKIVKVNPSVATDEGTMLGWFANSIMAGYDKGLKKGEQETTERIMRIIKRMADDDKHYEVEDLLKEIESKK